MNECLCSALDDLMREHLYCELTENKPQTKGSPPISFISPTLTITGKKKCFCIKKQNNTSLTLYLMYNLYHMLHLLCADFRMQLSLIYHGQKVKQVCTRSPDGCFILQGCVPLGNEQIYGPCTAQQLSFPPPSSFPLPVCEAEAINRLLCHLERGVLIWVAPDGVFIKRFCQGRVYWSGPMARNADRPNKLEREKTLKLLDSTTFLNGEAVN